jgi:archaellin
MFSTGLRGQIGTGTLIVFISVVLVAGAAAGVVTNTAGFLQFQSTETGESSTAEVSDRLAVAYSIGVVDSGGGETELKRLELIVKPAPDATAIDLDNTTVRYQQPTGVTTLLSENTADSAGPTFSIEPLQGKTDDNVLSDPADRSKLVIPLADDTTALQPLQRGEEVRLTLTTDSGANTYVQHTVPPTDPTDTAVRL